MLFRDNIAENNKCHICNNTQMVKHLFLILTVNTVIASGPSLVLGRIQETNNLQINLHYCRLLGKESCVGVITTVFLYPSITSIHVLQPNMKTLNFCFDFFSVLEKKLEVRKKPI